uniref:Uncharacterized protein n=1 Tax=Aotus nancymaae TaxID=37293 RepID=A0A2K5D8S3_AOTNA
MEEPQATPQPYFRLVLEVQHRMVVALHQSTGADSNSYGFPWEWVIWAATGFFAVLFFFLWRGFRSVRSWLYVEREKKLAEMLSRLIEEKRQLLEKLKYEGQEVESSLNDASFEKEATEEQSLEATCEKPNRFNVELDEEILRLVKELKEEKSKQSEQNELMADISKRIQSLEDETKSLKSQVALNENSQLQESQKQLLQEAEVWKEQVSELNKQKITLEDSKVHAEQVLNDKDNHIRTLTECLLKMKDWAAILGEDRKDGENLELEMNSESENGGRNGTKSLSSHFLISCQCLPLADQMRSN